MRTIRKIIIHCSATPEGRGVTVTDIDRWHKERGFLRIGYHYVVLLDGGIRKGREDAETGAHCQGHNSDSIGVCYVGGCDKNMRPKDTRTAAQKESLRKIVGILKRRYPGAEVLGHRDLNSGKDCPCFNAKKEYADI